MFPLIVRLKNSDALRADATVLRLLFEYGKDVHRVRTNSALTDEAWVGWLGARALEYRDRLVKTGSGTNTATIKDVASSLVDPSVSPDEVARRLSDVVDGNFFEVQSSLVGAKKYVLKGQPTVLGLGIAMLDSLEGAENTFEGVQAHALKWLEPVGAIDESTEVLRAALAILSALGVSDGRPTTDALLVLWLNAQNPSSSIERDAFAFGESFPRSMLTVADSLKVSFNGPAKIPELVHIAMRVRDSAELEAVRAELTNLIRCNTDQGLFELVIACQMHGRDKWLNGFIDADAASDQPWRQKRAAVLKAFHQMPSVDQLQWPEGETVGSLRALERNLLKWTNRGALAKHWWERFNGAMDADTAFAAWHVFLGSADRRAWVWRSRRPEPITELDRLRELHLRSNKDLFARQLGKPEEKTAKLADHLFGLDAPSKWLMLDGALAR